MVDRGQLLHALPTLASASLSGIRLIDVSISESRFGCWELSVLVNCCCSLDGGCGCWTGDGVVCDGGTSLLTFLCACFQLISATA